jgi:hypothetical protein
LHNRLEALALPSNCTEKGVIKLLDWDLWVQNKLKDAMLRR